MNRKWKRRPGRRRYVLVIDYAVKRELHVVGGERLPVVPPHVPAQPERPGEAIVRALPRLGQQRLYLVRQPRRLGKPLEHVAQGSRRVGVVCDSEVERQRLRDRGAGDCPALLADCVLEVGGVLLEPVHHASLARRRRLRHGRRRRSRGRFRRGGWPCRRGGRGRRCGLGRSGRLRRRRDPDRCSRLGRGRRLGVVAARCQQQRGEGKQQCEGQRQR